MTRLAERLEVRAFADAPTGRRPFAARVEDAVRSVAAPQAIAQAANAGRAVGAA